MKSRHLFIDVLKRAAAALTATAVFAGPTGVTLALDLAPLAARDADPAVNDLVDAFTQ